jgi:threonine dehydratase
VVVMPTTAPAVKVDGARGFGAEVVLEGTTSVERQRRAESIAAERGLVVIPAFDHEDVIAGQGSVGVEIAEQWPEVERVVVPVGGGGLLSGVAAWFRAERPGVQIIGVEPDAADAMKRSIAAGAPVTIESRPTIADGLMPVRPGDITYAHTAALVDEVVTVSDEAILEATRLLVTSGKLVVEFSGAATLAALLSGALPAGPRTALILSGGNIEPARLAALLTA